MNLEKSVGSQKSSRFVGFFSFIGLMLLGLMLLLHIFLMQGTAFGATEETPEAMVAALKQRNIDIDQREGKVKERESRLKLLEDEIRVMLNDFKKLKEALDQKEADRVSAKAKEEELRLVRLAKIYQSMPAKDAARRIEKLKESTALNLLRRIKEKVAAKILSNMNAGKAARYSEFFLKVKE